MASVCWSVTEKDEEKDVRLLNHYESIDENEMAEEERGNGRGVVEVRVKTDRAQDKKGDGERWQQLMPESARTCWKVPSRHPTVNSTKYSTLHRHVRIHVEPPLRRHWDPRPCLFKHLGI